MHRFNFSDQETNNLKLFLDRVSFNGLKGLEDANRILIALDRRSKNILELDEHSLDALVGFIDTVPIKGVKEVEAMMLILQVLSTPILEVQEEEPGIELE